MSTEQTTLDIVQLLDRDHREAEALLSRFELTERSERGDYFWQVVHELVGHEVAEEIAVYPALRRHAPGGEAIADARIAEQAQAEQLLAEMEKLDSASTDFATSFIRLRSEVLEHAKAEEATVFPALTSSESPDARAEQGERYLRAKASAPTHPHPHSPDTPPGNTLLGPIAALFDRARDAARRT
ncbi:MAG TPA: hemerythrin domain-containing protein [Acidimicrobiales bacterium]|jgi:hemerythrin superfamily protein